MRRSTRLALLGLVLLAAAAALPLVDFYTADWDRDYRYRTPTTGFCADAVAELPSDADHDEEFVVDRRNLSAAALADVERAEANGPYTVEHEADADGPFVFLTDHVARGTGCYAVRDTESGGYTALVTEAVNHRADTLQTRLVPWIDRTLLVAGAVSVLAGVGLAVRRRS
jgi:hypothetical protein